MMRSIRIQKSDFSSSPLVTHQERALISKFQLGHSEVSQPEQPSTLTFQEGCFLYQQRVKAAHFTVNYPLKSCFGAIKKISRANSVAQLLTVDKVVMLLVNGNVCSFSPKCKHFKCNWNESLQQVNGSTVKTWHLNQSNQAQIIPN